MNPEQLNLNLKTSTSEKDNKEQAKSEKEILWEQNRKKVNEITDALDFGIDEKIKEAVTAFLVYEFSTSQSCGGHTEKEEGEHEAAFPFVEVYAPEPEGWEDATGEKKKEIEREWTVENLRQQQKMTNLLAEFYQERDTPFDARLNFKNIGAFGGFRVQSFGADMCPVLTPEQQKHKLELYRKETDDFTKFLKNKFFYVS